MSFKEWSPERRKLALERAAATRARKKAAKAPQEFVQPPPERAPTLSDLGFTPPPDDDWADPDQILSAEEIEAARQEGIRRHREEQKKQARKAVADAAYDEVRRQAGTMPADEEEQKKNKELVWITIQMPRLRKPNGGEQEPEPLIIDRQVFVHGRRYLVERAQAVYLVDRMDKARRHVNTVDGRSRAYYNDAVGTVVWQGGVATGGPGGPTFDAIHKRPAS